MYHPQMKRFAVPALPLFLFLFIGFSWAAFGDRDPQGGFHHWRQTNPEATAKVDHRPWDDLLARYLSVHEDGVNRFRYGAVSAADGVRLAAYIGALEKVVVTELTGAEQLAYWINLYNAVTVRVILDHYPVESIRDIRFSWLSRGPWKEKLTAVEGRALSLDDIEHEIVRPVFGDNRVHYALNCASIGCPNLQGRAYTRDNLEASLQSAAREYINHPRGVRFDGSALIVSGLYRWYQADFGQNQRQVIEHLRQYAQPPLRRRLEGVAEITDFFYDWSLNDG